MKTNGVIAFCGSKGAGKSTSYEMFKKLFNGETEEIALAGHLKEVCSRVFNIDVKYFIDPSLKEVELDSYINVRADHIAKIFTEFNVSDDSYNYDKNIRPHIGQVFETPRQILQYVGTEVLHPIDPLIHVKIALTKKSKDKLTVVTDLRFVAEFEYFTETLDKSFTPVYVKNSKAELEASTDMHPSERQLSLFKNKCYKLMNETSLDELRQNLSTLVSQLFVEDKNVSVRTS